MKIIADFGIIIATIALGCVLWGIAVFPGCTPTKEIIKATIDCSEKALMEQAGSIIADIGGIIMDDDWRPKIAKIALQSGAVVAKCAMDALWAKAVKEIEKQGSCGWALSCLTGTDPNAEFKRARIEAWYRLNGYEVPAR
ncbi:MAG: hypothetical protein V1784_07165 [bacterium]